MTLTKERPSRPAPLSIPINMDAIQFVRSGPVSEIPSGTHAIAGRPRRWESIAQQIREASQRGDHVLYKVTGDRRLVERMRQGLEAEQKRAKLGSRCRAIPFPDGTWELYFTAIDPVSGKLFGQT